MSRIFELIAATSVGACLCIGPQNGEPLCPCKMRGVVVKKGRYVIPEQDLGPAKDEGELIERLMQDGAAGSILEGWEE